jgi:hypothetical protein
MTLKVTPNFIAQSAHVGWGYIFVTAPAMLFHVHILWIALGVVALTGAKEYWDAHGLETPDVAGNSWVDFAYWFLGVWLALIVLFISGQVKI